MKLGMLKTAAGLKLVGVSGDRKYIDLCQVDSSLPHALTDLLRSGRLADAHKALETGLAKGAFVTGDLGCPITTPEKIICIGLNYKDHAEETKAEIPFEPVCFGKFGNTLIGPGDQIRLPAVSQQVDYEAELVVVIGKPAYRVSEAEALHYVAGYMVGHDVSARDWQKGRPGGQWLLGKSPDTFAPIGPYLVTSDEIPDPHQLKISLQLNGQTMQDSSTSELLFNINQLIAHLAKIMTLQPGDLIFTGTPAGVGMARNPRVFLQPGDKVDVTIEHLGTLSNTVIRDE
ncbi:MAG: fumarylacetoacetate hydrolase family protein [Planctomycetaceae bacterium]|nr:fumarylacetoacetate hydrolase family protein [Planctomycetaceae bacterium]